MAILKNDSENPVSFGLINFQNILEDHLGIIPNLFQTINYSYFHF